MSVWWIWTEDTQSSPKAPRFFEVQTYECMYIYTVSEVLTSGPNAWPWTYWEQENPGEHARLCYMTLCQGDGLSEKTEDTLYALDTGGKKGNSGRVHRWQVDLQLVQRTSDHEIS